ncbi:1-acyl-sn-glycerol-3-phosphate acyltransferase [Aquimarina muelleri]|uniref:Glycerol acyltransferase n=1 Tax=Aquimarina muelleri TaxID=279356 RepID=A0A918N383_9FLAO|nr:1-acyl-sn-glycerol-3-phosphate acyltransferase [Aquimarina muelleri]MCX2762014.1 MMPL family transporter [Aquimarina muelleri]GGX25010.1 glycerol acyltransferase [Aquimarina muelleri]
MNSFFYNLYKAIVSRKIVGFGTLVIIMSFLFFVASKIQFEEDITKLIPSSDKTSEIQKVLKTVNFADKIIVNITRKPQGSVDDLTQYASQLIDSITAKSGQNIKQIQGNVKEEEIFNTLEFVYKNLPLFLQKNDYNIIKNKIQKDSIEAITNSNYKILVSPTGIIAKDNILKDPLGLSFIALKKLKQLNFGDGFTLHNGFLLSKDQNHILLFITPKLKSSETAKNATFVEDLYRINNQLNDLFKDKVKSEYFGGTLIAVANAQQIKQDIQLTISIAITILLIILVFFYKKVTIPIILFVPTIFGGLLAIALLYLIRAKISAISLGIGSVLLGVTLDYSLHILTHIRSSSNIKAVYKEITIPVLMSSLTTALAFLCLLFLDSQALQDLGVFAAISVVGSSFFALIFIPQVYKKTSQKKPKTTLIDNAAQYPLHKNKWVIITLTLLLIVSVFTYNKVQFNKDISKLNFEPQELKDAQLRLDALTNIASKSIYLAAYENSEQGALQINDKIFEKLQLLKNEGKVIDFSSIGSLIYSEKTQKERISRWNSFWNSSTITNTKANLIESGNKLGFKSTSFGAFYTLLESDFKPLEITDYNALNTISIADYITTKDDFTTVTTLVKVKDENAQYIVDVFKDQSQTIVIDRKHMNETFLGNLKNDFNKLVGYSLIVVLLILLLFYRSLSLTLVTSIPIAITWLLTIGIMGLFSLEFNIFNIIISTFIFGLGIDYSIFMTNGLLHEYRTGEKALATHKTSIILSVITTILGVGVLIFAKHPALYTISLLSIIGILSAIVVSFTIQPQLFRLFIGSKTKRPTMLRLFIHSVLSFGYYGLGGLFLSLFSVFLIKIVPLPKKIKMKWFHEIMSKFMKSVLYTNPFISKKVINQGNETFEKPGVIIANHTSFLDILVIGMLYPKIIFLVNDWVYNSPFFGKAVRLAGFYPVSSGIENGLEHLKKKIDQGYSLIAFPEGTRSNTNKIKRFHKGAFYLAEQFQLDIIPILIHGNSEILPKGSFIIKDGSVTLKILDRIKVNDASFGENYARKTKQIGAYFKNQFEKLRNEIEHDEYFNNIILEEYRYKGDLLYKEVVKDLKINKEIYKIIIDTVGKKETILHISKDSGQLDFLLSLDSTDRKIINYIEKKDTRNVVRNSFISNNHSKIICLDDIEEISSYEASVLIINIALVKQNQLEKLFSNKIKLLILLKESKDIHKQIITNLGFEIICKKGSLIILGK